VSDNPLPFVLWSRTAMNGLSGNQLARDGERFSVGRGPDAHTARVTSATITMSHEMEAALPTAARRRNAVIPTGADRDPFFPRERDEARADLGWSPDERIVIFVANPSLPYKRHALVRAACEHAAALLGEVRLEVVHGVEPDRVSAFMAAADCLLHTSSTEGSPNVVKEALACNVLIIATPAGDISELLVGVDSSQVCEPTSEALGAALASVLDPPRRTNGRDVSADLGREAIAERVISHCESMLRRRSGARKALLREARTADAMGRAIHGHRE
jgi:teichuronic acid biosynthesis glycosyltransferase TuaC